MRKPLYMEVTRDKYELPLAVADTPEELAAMRLVSKWAVYKSMRERRKRGTRGRFICVVVDTAELVDGRIEETINWK